MRAAGNVLGSGSASLLFLLLHFCGPSLTAQADGVGVSTEPDEIRDPTAPAIHTIKFHRYQVPAQRSPLANRDIEFLWSQTYKDLEKDLTLDDPGTGLNDLDRFGKMLCETNSNAFGFDQSDIRLIYDYFNVRAPGFRDSLYKIDAQEIGFRTYVTDYPSNQNHHVDTYIWYPGGAGAPEDDHTKRPSYPSSFSVAAEDSVTAYPNIFHLNAFDLRGPSLAEVGVTDATRWTRPSGPLNQGFNHEFEHCINKDNSQSNLPARYLHLFANAAEVIGGLADGAPQFDVNYRRNLIANESVQNYQAWLSFAAYVAFNYRGVDPSSAGRHDDLLWRWARQHERQLTALAPRLSVDECAECAGRSYFTGLVPNDRFHLLLHQWRVAQFVNKPTLAQGQYGYPPQFGFDPMQDVGNWQNVDPSAGAADSFNIPMQVTLNVGHRLRDMSQAGFAVTDAGFSTSAHTLSLEPFGSDYWVVKSDPSLHSADRDLVVRVTSEGGCGGIGPQQGAPVRLMISAIAYSNQPGAGDSLWKHPEWAVLAIPPKWTDVSQASGAPVEIVVPSFGMTHRAALIVVTGSQPDDDTSVTPNMPYRLNLGLSSGPRVTPNPTPFFTGPSFDCYPVWHPSGASITFMRKDDPNNPSVKAQIHWKNVNGSISSPVVQPPRNRNQFRPDWSPRGDWIVFDEESTAPTDCDVIAYNIGTGEVRRLTSRLDHEFMPAFSPNGQQVAYVRITGGPGFELRRVNLDGTGDSLICAQTLSVQWPRWSPDGRHIYFVSGADQLHAVSTAVGSTPFSRSNLVPSAHQYDLPLGKNRMVVADDWVPPRCPTKRLIARDTVTASNEVLFSGAEGAILEPRWSFDGTRVTYCRESGAARDIYFGQVGYNRPPLFTDPQQVSDREVFAGLDVYFALSATDPDGEPVTYVGAQLPPGATLSPTGVFSWPDPHPVGADVYFVLRALDPSGGVDNRVVKYHVNDPGGGAGCPFADTRDSTGWNIENSLLGRSLSSAFAKDTYRLKTAPADLGGRYHIRLRENEQEFTTLDEVKLVAVDHPADVRAFPAAEGIILGTRVPAARVTTSSGRDITLLVRGGGAGFMGGPGDTLLVEMRASGSAGSFGAQTTHECVCPPGVFECDVKQEQQTQPAPEDLQARPAALAYDQAVLENTGIVVQAPDGGGGWRDVRRHYPREFADETAIDSLGGGRVRLVFVGNHRLRFVGYVQPATISAVPQVLPLVSARHSRVGDVRGALERAGGNVAMLTPGDTLNLQFSALPRQSGQVREWLLVTNGVYSSAPPTRLEPTTSDPSLHFGLAQNQPNPFEGTTLIGFRVPTSSLVRIEIFDPSGRRVRTLAEAVFAAGHHSLVWDQRDALGSRVRPGVYLYRMTTEDFREQRKMVVLAD